MQQGVCLRTLLVPAGDSGLAVGGAPAGMLKPCTAALLPTPSAHCGGPGAWF